MDEMTPEQADLYRVITQGPRVRQMRAAPMVDENGLLAGPFGPMLLSPPIGNPLQALGAAIRYESSLSPRVRETAILMVAASAGSDFEWSAHKPLALAAGLDETELESIRSGGDPSGRDEEEAALFLLARLLIEEANVDDETYARLVEASGERPVFETCALVGHYRTLAMVMKLFRIG